MTVRIRVSGRVQGVGFRPAVRRAALALGVCGEVRNFGGSAEILCNAEKQQLQRFLETLRKLPSPVQIDSIAAVEIAPRRFLGFTEAESAGAPECPILPADIGVCSECLRDLQNEDDPRFHYPYISCAQCGPRYTIIRALPYDRVRTAMDAYEMCPLCTRQYEDPDDRRGYGQTISCPDCGPQLLGETRDGARAEKEEAVCLARGLLEEGRIIAVKAVGGYNLVCRADSGAPVRLLRKLKHRSTKPFAVLFASAEEAASVCRVSGEERKLLASPARPIVLLDRGEHWRKFVCEETAGAEGTLGAFLPAMGLYALLAERLPLVVTSCNRSGEPILFRDEEMLVWYGEHPEISGFFRNSREILRPADDSVARVVNGTPQILRRTRGYLPEPVVQNAPQGDLLALGAQLEPAICLASGGRLYPAAVPGDLDETKTRELLRFTVRDLSSLLNIRPKAVVCDLHPLYYTTELAGSLDLPVLRVQHHHAHALSVMAEHGLSSPVFAACFDGTGYGEDGSVWGGEFLRCAGTSFVRAGHLAEIPMIGGDLSMKQGWKSAFCHLIHAGLPSEDPRFPVVRAALENGINGIRSSSMGRLFDAVSAVLGLCDENTHQGRCAVACENAARRAEACGSTPVPMAFAELPGGVYDPAPLFFALTAAQDKDAAALGFHCAVIDLVLHAAERAGLCDVVLAGGVFANRILLEGCTAELRKRGFSVYWNRLVPPGDGGVCLGQAYYGLLKG